MLRVLAALCLVVGVALLFGMLLRKAVPARRPRALQLLERLTLSKQAAVWLIEVEGRRLLVGSGERGLTLLSECDGDDRALELRPDVPTQPVKTHEELRAPISRQIGSLDAAVRAWLGRDDGRFES